MKGTVRIADDAVTILDENGVEVVHWIIDEVEEDSGVAFVIANAIQIFYEKGIEEVKKLIGR